MKNHQNLMRGFEDIGLKGNFLAKKAGGQTRILFKNPLGTFFSLAKTQLCAKFQKNLMHGSSDIPSRTHERTDEQTHERESIGPSPNAERPKIM